MTVLDHSIMHLASKEVQEYLRLPAVYQGYRQPFLRSATYLRARQRKPT
jgi:hypothetical protein